MAKAINLIDVKHDIGTSGIGWEIKNTQELFDKIAQKLNGRTSVKVVVLGGNKNNSGFNFYCVDGNELVIKQIYPHGNSKTTETTHDLAITKHQDVNFIAGYFINGSLDFADEGDRINENYWKAVKRFAENTDKAAE